MSACPQKIIENRPKDGCVQGLWLGALPLEDLTEPVCVAGQVSDPCDERHDDAVPDPAKEGKWVIVEETEDG